MCKNCRLNEEKLFDRFVGMPIKDLANGTGEASPLCETVRKRIMIAVYGTGKYNHIGLVKLLMDENTANNNYARARPNETQFAEALKGSCVKVDRRNREIVIMCVCDNKTIGDQRDYYRWKTFEFGDYTIDYYGEHKTGMKCPGYCIVLKDFLPEVFADG